MTLHVDTITTTGSYTIPEGVTSMLVECIGGGGNGANGATTTTGGGGGAGAYSKTLEQETTPDSSGNGHTATLVGGPAREAGTDLFGSRLLTSDGKYASIPTHADFDFNVTNWTGECRIKTVSAASVFMGIFDVTSTAVQQWVMGITLGGGGGKADFSYIDGSGTQHDLISSASFNDGVEHVLRLTKNGTALTLFVDGSSVATHTITAGIQAMPAVPLTIGDLPGTFSAGAGSFDEVRISNVVRSDSTAAPFTTDANTKLLLHFDTVNSVNVVAGATWTATVGGIAGDTSFVRVTGGAYTSCLAKGGTNGSGTTAGTGGAAGSGTGDTKFSGGNGGAGGTIGGGGGGGGAGSGGAGANGATGGASNAGGAGTATGGGTGGTGVAAGAGGAGSVQGGGGGGGGLLSGAGGAGARGYIVLSYQQNIARSNSVTATGTPTVVKLIGKPMTTVTATGTPTLLKRVGKPFAVTATGTASIVKQVGKPLAVTATGTPVMTRLVTAFRSFAVTATGTPTMVRHLIAARSFAATCTGTVALLVTMSVDILNRITGGTTIRKIITYLFDD